MVKFIVCRDLQHAEELHDAGLLVLNMDCDMYRSRPQYVPSHEETEEIGKTVQYLYEEATGWRKEDFGYLEED